MKSLWWWVSLTMVLHRNHVSSDIVEPRLYSRFYDGGWQLNASFTNYIVASRISCAHVCSGKSGCWSFSWDKSTKQCQLLDAVPSSLSAVPAPPTLQSYFVGTVNGKLITIPPGKGSWPFCKTSCENVGGRLFLPEDSAFCRLLHQVFQESRLAIGMYREPSETNVWRDMDGQIITRDVNDWYTGEPDNGSGEEYYILSRLRGIADIPSTSIDMACLCEVEMSL